LNFISPLVEWDLGFEGPFEGFIDGMGLKGMGFCAKGDKGLWSKGLVV